MLRISWRPPELHGLYIALIVVILGACASTPPNLGELKQQVISYRENGQYENELANVVEKAKRYLEARVKDGGQFAIVLDVDETALSNWPVMQANDFGFIKDGPCTLPEGPCGWHAWVEMAAAPANGAVVDIYRLARRQGVAVFFITARQEKHRAATERNLRATGYQDWSKLILRSDDVTLDDYISFKVAARRSITEQGFTILINMGDHQGDLMGGYAERSYLVPNPFYRIPYKISDDMLKGG